MRTSLWFNIVLSFNVNHKVINWIQFWTSSLTDDVIQNLGLFQWLKEAPHRHLSPIVPFLRLQLSTLKHQHIRTWQNADMAKVR